MIGEVWFVFLSFASVLNGEVHQFSNKQIGDSVFPVWNGFFGVSEDFPNVGLVDRLRRSTEEDDGDVENYKSDLEEPREVPTRPDYKGKGHWAKGSLPDGKQIDVGFVPQKVYTQVRKYDTVKHLPRTAAAQEAVTYEEKVNAPRLREVLSQKKIQQVYEEEGYEDGGYDHGGYNHHGSQSDDFEKNDDLNQNKRNPDNDAGSAQNVAMVSGKTKNSTSKSEKLPVGVRWKRFHTETQTTKKSWDDDVTGKGKTKSVVDEKVDVTTPFVKEPVTVKNDVNSTDKVGRVVAAVSSTERESQPIVRNDGETEVRPSMEARDGDIDLIETAESHRSRSAIHGEPSGRSLEARVINDPRPKGSGMVTFPGRHTRRQYAVGRPLDVYVQESVGYGVRRPVYGVPVPPTVHHYLPVMPAFPSFYSDNPSAYTAPVISQMLPVKTVITTTVPPPLPPTSPPPTTTVQPALNTGPVQFLNAADALNAYATLLQQSSISSNKPVIEDQNYADIIQPRFNSTLDVDISASTYNKKHNNGTSRGRKPSRFLHPISNGRERRYNNFTRVSTNYPSDSGPSGKGHIELKNPSPHTRHPSLPRDSSEDASSRIVSSAAQTLLSKPPSMQRPLDPVKYIESLTIAHFSNGANVPRSPPSVQNERLKELARQLNSHSDDSLRKYAYTPGNKRRKRQTTGIQYDHEKYPFYDSFRGISRDSALRYATNPDDLPKKSPGGMEFYESKDRLVKCDEPQPPSDIVPKSSEDGEWNENPQPQNLPRMEGLGDSIDCLKVRYFGADPLDNPFFKEGPISDFPLYQLESNIKDHISAHQRKIREIGQNNRLMIIPPRHDSNSSQLIQNNHSTIIEHIRGEERSNGHTSFPYKNHKPESAEVSESVHNLRATSPYKYYSEHDDESYFPIYDADVHDSDSEDSKRHKYYQHNYKQKYVHKTKKRTRPRPFHYQPRPLPVSIYSIIAGGKSYPIYRHPILYASSSNVNRVIPIYHLEPSPPSDSYVSDSKSSYQTAPTKWYIVRPGEFTENKDIASDTQQASSSIWSYINPLRWWFPSYFDKRRGEPKHRRRRSSEQELFNKILAKTNNASLESRIFGNLKSPSSEVVRNRKLETTTGQPISIEEFKAKINANSDKKGKTSTKLNRLTGGFISRSSYSTTPPSYISSMSVVPFAENMFGMVTLSTTPMTMSSPSGDMNPTSPPPMKSKVLFPRTRTPSKRRSHPTKSNVNPVSRNALTTTTTTSTTSTTPLTTTRMYKPKRIVKKKFDKHLTIDAFPVLRRSNQHPSTPSPFDSVESSAPESGSIEEPRRLQQVEHRRVTKEEVYKTSYIPEEDGRSNRNMDGSLENYSTSYSESGPVTDPTLEQDNHTLTYLMNPVTGVGSWGEQPRRTTWKPKRRYPKRHLDNKSGQKSTYSYPPIGIHDTMVQGSTPNKNRKRHSIVPQYDSQAYIAGLMNQMRPSSIPPRSARFVRPNLKSIDSARNAHHPEPSSDETLSHEEVSVETQREDSGITENYPPPTKSPPKFILDPGKRKYFYVKIR